jgi:recombination protein RecA
MSTDRDKALDMALSQIDKQFGKGSIMRMGEKTTLGIDAISTGALSLDLALGIGGLPRGRVTEIYGPESSGKSTLAMHVVAEAQRNGGVCAYIDAEHAMDPIYAKAIGVDIDQLLISQPDTGEQALEIADMLVRSGAIDVVVIDSVAALTPKAEIEGEMGDTHVGLQARLMSQALRKLTGNLNKTNTIAIFINQLREKIGVMFGCMSYGTRVTLADGTQEKIGKIVNQRLPVEVLSYDIERGELVAKPVTDWFDNGVTDRFLQFTVERGGGNGRAQFAATENHLISTPAGWRPAGELIVGDRVLQAVPEVLSDLQWEVILGGLMGDGSLSPTRSGNGSRFRWGHGAAQVQYGDWKASLFENVGVSRSTNARGAVFHDVRPLPELAELRHAVYVGGKKVLSDDYLKRLTPLSLAIWYMDDGGFTVRSKGLQERTAGGSGRSEMCVEAFSLDTRVRLRDYLAETWGIAAKLDTRGARQIAVLQFPTAETAKFHALVAPFVHPSMAYKLLPRYRGRFSVEPVFAPARQTLMPMRITSIKLKPPTRSMHRFDIEVGGTHNYFVDGVMVHNSPETTPGGRALKFYSSVRLDIRRIESLKDGTEVVGNRTRVKVVKNKCVAAGTFVFDPTSGVTRRIDEVVAGAGAAVVAADKAGQLHVRPIVQRFDQGEAEVITLGLRDGTALRVTPDHRILTDRGWREAGELATGDRVARPRRFLGFGDARPYTPEEARLLGYLIGDGYVGGKTPVSLINAVPALHDDVTSIVAQLGCTTRRRGLELAISHRPGEVNRVLELVRRAGIWGHLAPEKRLPAEFFLGELDADIASNVVFGLLESDGYVSREQTGGVRVGYTTTSEQLAHQLHWLLLRWGIGSSVRSYDPTQKRPSVIAGRTVRSKLPVWEVRVSGIDNVARFADVIPMWGPRGVALTAMLADPALRAHRGSQRNYLPACQVEPVLAYLAGRGLSATQAAAMIPGAGDPRGGMRQVLGHSRLRRDRVQRLADALDSEFLRSVVDEDVWYDQIVSISAPEWADVYDIEVDEHHTFVADDVVVSNCAPPFRQAEFDIMYGKGISREGSLLDMSVDLGIVKKSGAWFTYEGEQLGQGRENAKTFLTDNPEIMMEISDKVLTAAGLRKADDVPEAAAAPDAFTPADDEPIQLD